MIMNNKDAPTARWMVWIVIAFLAFVFLTGGGSRADIQSLVLLRPLAAIALGVGVWFLAWNQAQTYRWLWVVGLGILLQVAMHLIPLPPSMLQSLAQGELYNHVDSMAGLTDVWRPMTLTPPAAWNALFSLLIPFAVLVWGMQIKGDARHAVIVSLIVLAMISCLLGLLQVIGPSKGPMFLYRITNHGMAVGLFANRNHHAVFLACMLPILAIYATTYIKTQEQASVRRWIALMCGALIMPMILVTGSRAGLIAAVIGLASMPLLWGMEHDIAPAKRKTRSQLSSFLTQHFNKIVVAVGGILLVVATVYFSRARSVDRFSQLDGADDLRLDIWRVSFEILRDYFPFGSGIGSFVEVYQMYEPDALLNPSYANHAHNDWLEAVMTGGVTAGLILTVMVALWGLAAFALWKERSRQDGTMKLARLGAVVIFILAVSSVFDYPLRVPSLAALFTLASIWLYDGMRRLNKTGAR